MKMNSMQFRQLIMAIMVCCTLSAWGTTITEPIWLRTTGCQIDVTSIDYGKKSTTVYFSTSRHLEQPLTIRPNIFIVGDDGLCRHAKNVHGIEFGKEYILGNGRSMSFSIEFESVGISNKVLDVRAPGIFSIFGLHAQDFKLTVPRAEGNIPPVESDYSFFEMRDVEIEGTFHDPGKELGDVVQINYIAPRNLPNQRNSQSAKVDADGHFRITFPMYAPQVLWFLQPYKHGFYGPIYARPGDKLSVELFDSYVRSDIVLNNMSGHDTYGKLGYAPSYGFDTNKYLSNIQSSSRFTRSSYREQYDNLMAEYRMALDFADYVCWHYQLSSYETALVLGEVHSQYIQWLLMTDNAAWDETRSAQLSFKRQQYTEIVDRMDYSYLKNIDPNSTILATVQGMIMIPSLLYQTALIQQCISQVKSDDADRLQKVIDMQKEALERVAGWKGQTLMLELLIVQDFFRMEGVDLDDKANISSVRELLHHPYSRQCFDVYYADYTSKQAK
ncbi:MAG: hypothetical protein IJ557_03560 [Bacteroidaceae bacterium]|nr:hypothetical protein [Bacteroidaceae bacterium]MBR1378188.1 hypothetical protein [Bacteroidaceae bacterium]